MRTRHLSFHRTVAALLEFMERGPNTVRYKKNFIEGMNRAELKEELKMINACVKNLGVAFQSEHGLVHKKITAIIRGSDFRRHN